MESKALILSFLLAFLLVGAGFSIVAMEGSEEDEVPEDETGTTTIVNNPPSILVDSVFSMDWTGDNATLSGFISDEVPQNNSLAIRLLDSNLVEINTYNLTPSTNGAWSVEIPVSDPGSWVVEFIATDDAGQSSDTVLTELSIIAPFEEQVTLTFRWDEPVENDTSGTISGLIVHEFPSSCLVQYHPLGQSPALIVEGVLNSTTGAYSILVDTDSHNTEGDIVSQCGIFTESEITVRVILPMPPEPVGDEDGDAVPDDTDECPSTPEGEPVYATGCSDSETDDDEDGVMNDVDACPNTPMNETVDVNGCSQTQLDDDNDGVNNAGDLCPATPANEVADANGCAPSQRDTDGDTVNDAVDQCPNTPAGTAVGADGCPIPDWDPEDSWLCQNGQGPWVKDLNGDGNSYSSNTNGVNSAGGGGSGPWFQCEVSVTTSNGEMVVDTNGIPNHDFLSTMGCCADEVDLEWHIPLSPVNDTSGGHDTSNCPASAGRWECAPARGPVAVSVNGVPIYGVEEGPGGDAIALHFKYFNEDRQPIFLGYCTSHSAGNNFHYHYDSQCSSWTPGVGETISDYDWTELDNTQHSPIIGWAFDGYPIYGMYGNDGSGGIKAITSSYEVERTQENGDQGYNGIDDWNYVNGAGDLDECNGRWGVTPEYPEGTYHYVSTPLSGSTKLVTDTDGNQVAMIGMPYFLLCYHGVADLAAQPSNGQGGGGGGGGGPPGPPGGQTIILYEHMPELLENVDNLDVSGQELLWNSSFVLIGIIALIILRRHLK